MRTIVDLLVKGVTIWVLIFVLIYTFGGQWGGVTMMLTIGILVNAPWAAYNKKKRDNAR